ncbi:MAG TPA: sigma-70 family RNA polymerase sigma factor [Gemmataceae bacterium]|nr:sigma-70 family RNA polymerase sigma factor [Gemmataceae bacterium]
MGRAPSSQTSPTLLGRLRANPADQAAWNGFVARYAPKILGWCRHWGLQQADAEDVTQSVLFKLAAKMRDFVYDPARSFRSWLKTLAHHAWADFLEARNRPGVGTGDSHVVERLKTVAARDDLATQLEGEFDKELFDEAVARVRLRVTPAKWETFKLLAIDGLSGAEVAQRQNMRVSTAYVVRSKVQKMLQEEIVRLESPGGPTEESL